MRRQRSRTRERDHNGQNVEVFNILPSIHKQVGMRRDGIRPQFGQQSTTAQDAPARQRARSHVRDNPLNVIASNLATSPRKTTPPLKKKTMADYNRTRARSTDHGLDSPPEKRPRGRPPKTQNIPPHRQNSRPADEGFHYPPSSSTRARRSMEPSNAFGRAPHNNQTPIDRRTNPAASSSTAYREQLSTQNPAPPQASSGSRRSIPREFADPPRRSGRTKSREPPTYVYNARKQSPPRAPTGRARSRDPQPSANTNGRARSRDPQPSTNTTGRARSRDPQSSTTAKNREPPSTRAPARSTRRSRLPSDDSDIEVIVPAPSNASTNRRATTTENNILYCSENNIARYPCLGVMYGHLYSNRPHGQINYIPNPFSNEYPLAREQNENGLPAVNIIIKALAKYDKKR